MRMASVWFFGIGVVLSAQLTELSVLGGSCAPEVNPSQAELTSWHESVSAYPQKQKSGDIDAAIELAKKIVRGRCSNEHWRFTLVSALSGAKRFAEAVVLLDAFYDRGSNAIAGRLAASGNTFQPLLLSSEFKGSALAAKLAGDEKALLARRAVAEKVLGSIDAPAADYIAKGACPFECCRFGGWTATATTELFDGPGGSRVAQLAIGERVEALTGEVHLQPIPILVRLTNPPGLKASAGSIVFRLDDIGEGYGRVWVNGKIVDADLTSVGDSCRAPGPTCWGEFVRAGDSQRSMLSEWWIKIRTKDGKVGWTREGKNFSGLNGCG